MSAPALPKIRIGARNGEQGEENLDERPEDISAQTNDRFLLGGRGVSSNSEGRWSLRLLSNPSYLGERVLERAEEARLKKRGLVSVWYVWVWILRRESPIRQKDQDYCMPKREGEGGREYD